MPKVDHHGDFKVNLVVQAAGPIRPRTKYKEHKHFRAEATIQLPFMPYPGLYLTMSKPQKRGHPLNLYLRVRAVTWQLPEECFECVADEILGSSVSDETMEIRGGPRIEQHYLELQANLKTFGFVIDTETYADLRLNKRPDGSLMEPI